METPNRAAPRITLYTKPECELCDEAKAVLSGLQGEVPFEVLEIDITADLGLYERFHDQIPVGFLEGRKLFKYRVDPDRLRRQLRRRSRWLVGRWFHLGIAILLSGLLSLTAWATHEQDHRFTISGSVRDGSSFPGQPLRGREIRFLNAKTGQPWEIVDAQGRERPTVTTDREGQYSAILHAHNEDLGAVVKIVVDGTEKELVLTFNPQDVHMERRARVDIVVFPK